MKRVLFLLLVLPFLLPIRAAAQSPSMAFDASSAAVASTPAVTGPSDYTLPYPGLLPDNPLYGLKVARDRLIWFLIADPLKKAQFDLLQADKRLQAGVYLVKTEGKGKAALAQQTISKGYNYYAEAIAKLHEAKTQGKDVTDLARKMESAADKHVEVLHEVTQQVGSGDTQKFTSLTQRIQAMKKQVDEFIPK